MLFPGHKRHLWLMPLSLLLAFIQSAWPYPYAFRSVIPDAVLLVCLYWTLRRPHTMKPLLAAVIGLSRDVLQGSLLGQHVFSMTVTLYLCQQFSQRARQFTRWQQSLAVMALTALYLTLGQWIHLLHNPGDENEHLWLSVLTSGLCWPVFYGVLHWMEGRRIRPKKTA